MSLLPFLLLVPRDSLGWHGVFVEVESIVSDDEGQKEDRMRYS